jgi:hypothetical protein
MRRQRSLTRMLLIERTVVRLDAGPPALMEEVTMQASQAAYYLALSAVFRRRSSTFRSIQHAISG